MPPNQRYRVTIFMSLFLACGLLLTAQAQTTFHRAWHYPDEDYAEEVFVLPDGYWLFGTGHILGGTGYAPFAMRLDRQGREIWKQAYHQANQTRHTEAVAMNTDGDALLLTRDGSLLQIDQTGNLLWSRQYGGPGFSEFLDIQVLTDQRLALLATQAGDMMVFITSATGQLQSQWRYESTAFDIVPRGLQQLPDGGFLIHGYFDGAPLIVPSLIRLDASGQVRFSQRYSSTDFPGGHISAVVPESAGQFSCWATNFHGSQNAQMRLFRVDSLGAYIWGHLYGGPHNLSSTAMIHRPDGGFMASGWSFQQGANLLHLSPQGQLLQTMALPPYNPRFITSIRPCPDGGYIFTASGEIAQNSDYDAHLYKVDATGMAQCDVDTSSLVTTPIVYQQNTATPLTQTTGTDSLPFTSFTVEASPLQDTTRCLLVGAEVAAPNARLRAWPNPASEQLQVEVFGLGEGRLCLMDVFGKVVRSAQVGATGARRNWEVGDLPVGLYYLYFEGDGGSRSQKILILH